VEAKKSNHKSREENGDFQGLGVGGSVGREREVLAKGYKVSLIQDE
jgi:hypothetical protein